MISTIAVKRMEHGHFSEISDQLAVEEPLQIQLLSGSSGMEQTKNIAVTMRTPGNDEELAAGFLFTEGIIEKRADLLQIIAGASGENTVLAILHGHATPRFSDGNRNFYISSSCGVCGKTGIDAVRKELPVYPDIEPVCVKSSVLHALPDMLRNEQSLFKSTGGLHGCTLFDLHGNFISLREDVGRHNALDKLIGAAFLSGTLPLQQHVLLLSGRASFELLQKAAQGGIRIVASIGAPSSLAVQLAKEAGITLIGFLKADRFNIYSGEERITLSEILI